VFVRDLVTNVSELVSAHDPNLPSATPNGFSTLFPGPVSTNGNRVAFSSWANNLAGNDTNRCPDVFVRDLAGGTNFLVSVNTNGVAGNSISIEPAISGNGRYVAFASIASDLMPGDTNLAWDVFVRDLQSGTDSLVSVSTNGGFGNNDSDSPAISTDGRFVLFSSKAQNLAAGCTNLFLRDLQSGQTYGLTTGPLVSRCMTPDGHFVAFVGAIGGSANLYLYVWNSLTAARIYTNTSSSLTNISISPDGRWVAYTAGNLLFAEDLIAKTNCLIGSGPFGPQAGLQFSGDDRFLAYATSAAQVASDTNGASDIYLYDFQSGTNLLVSQSFFSIGAANGAADSPALSPDGRFVVYRSYASNAVPGDSNNVPDLFLYDRVTQTTILLSVNLSGTATADNRSLTPVFSGDGKTLVFQSWASDLTTQDFNLGSDVFALDLSGFQSGTNQTNALSALQADIILVGTPSSASGQNPVIAWPFTPGTFTYGVLYKDDLNDPVWHNLNGNLTVLGGRAYINDLTPSASQRFYRIVLNN
jgi:Tol biopolymer transport system component